MIEVCDTGVGIKKENLDKLFMDFARLDEHSKMNAQGTGLGLSICKKMVEQMGGKVSVTSSLGEGSVFAVEMQTKAKKPIPEQRKRDILINTEEENKEELIVNRKKTKELPLKKEILGKRFTLGSMSESSNSHRESLDKYLSPSVRLVFKSI